MASRVRVVARAPADWVAAAAVAMAREWCKAEAVAAAALAAAAMALAAEVAERSTRETAAATARESCTAAAGSAASTLATAYTAVAVAAVKAAAESVAPNLAKESTEAARAAATAAALTAGCGRRRMRGICTGGNSPPDYSGTKGGKPRTEGRALCWTSMPWVAWLGATGMVEDIEAAAAAAMANLVVGWAAAPATEASAAVEQTAVDIYCTPDTCSEGSSRPGCLGTSRGTR